MAKRWLARRNKLRDYGLAVGGLLVAFILGTTFLAPIFDKRSGLDIIQDIINSNPGNNSIVSDNPPSTIIPFLYETTYAPENSFGASDFIEQKVNWSFVEDNTQYLLTRDGVDVTSTLEVNFSYVFTNRKYSYAFTAGAQGYFQFTLTFNSHANSSWIDTANHTVYFNYSENEQLFYNYSDIWSIVGQFDSSFSLVDGVFTMVLGRIVNKNVVVVLDPTFGYTTVGDWSLTADGRIFYSTFITPATYYGVAQNMSAAYSGAYPSSWNIQHALYYASNNTLIAQTESEYIVYDNVKKFYTLDFVEPKPNLTPSTSYILATWHDGTADPAYWETGYTGVYYDTETYDGSFPTTLANDGVAETNGDGKLSVYCTYNYATTSTYVDAISPYWQDDVSTVALTATDGDITPDSVSLYYRWSQTNTSDSWGGGNWAWNNDTFDAYNTDVDSSADKGTETSPTNAQGTSRDSSLMTIQESDYGLAAVDETDYVDGFTGTDVAWIEYGSTPYIESIDYPDGSYIYTSTNGADEYWFTFSNTAQTGSGFTTTIYFYMKAGDTDDDFNWYVDWTGDNTPEASGTITDPGAVFDWFNTGTITGLDTATEYNAARVWVEGTKGGSKFNTMYVDAAYIRLQRAAQPNYCIDLEYNWTAAPVGRSVETLCMYFTAHTGGTETLNVNYRNGASWTSLGTVTATGWKNITATGLTNNYYTIQLIGASEAGDTVQDTWTVDCIFLQTYNNTGNPSPIGYNWSLWSDASNPDTGSPWAWTFDCPNETGYYEFYSIGKKAGYGDESAPASADARCHVNFSVAYGDWNQINDWNITLQNTSSYYQINDWNITLQNTSVYHIISDWNITIENFPDFNSISEWNITLQDFPSWTSTSDWNITLQNYTVATWNSIDDWNITLQNNPIWNSIGDWNITLQNSTTSNIISDWNITLQNTSAYHIISDWNITLTSTLSFNSISDWNLTLSNASSWHQIEDWNITLTSTPSSNIINDWNITLQNYSAFAWNQINDWNLTLQNTSGYHSINDWNITLSNISAYSQIEEWNLTLQNISIYHQITDWNITLQNTSTWHQIEEWNITLTSAQSWTSTSDWNITLQNTSSYNIINDWNITIQNTSIYHIIDDWNITLTASQDWNQIADWNITLSNITFNWNTVSDWNITLQNTSTWHSIQEWNITLTSVQNWHIIQDWNITVQNTTQYKTISEWNITLQNYPSWNIINDWNITLQNYSTFGWNIISEWNLTLQNTSSYHVISDWNITLSNLTLNWFAINDWNITLSNTSSYHIVTDWNITLKNTTAWKTIADWNITLQNYSALSWNAIQEWNITLTNTSSWHIIDDWYITLYNISFDNITLSNPSPNGTSYRIWVNSTNISGHTGDIHVSITRNHTDGNLMNTSIWFNDTFLFTNSTWGNGTISFWLFDYYSGSLVSGHTYNWTVNCSASPDYANESYNFTTSVPKNAIVTIVSRLTVGLIVGIGIMIPFLVLILKRRRKRGNKYGYQRETITLYRK